MNNFRVKKKFAPGAVHCSVFSDHSDKEHRGVYFVLKSFPPYLSRNHIFPPFLVPFLKCF